MKIRSQDLRAWQQRVIQNRPYDLRRHTLYSYCWVTLAVLINFLDPISNGRQHLVFVLGIENRFHVCVSIPTSLSTCMC